MRVYSFGCLWDIPLEYFSIFSAPCWKFFRPYLVCHLSLLALYSVSLILTFPAGAPLERLDGTIIAWCRGLQQLDLGTAGQVPMSYNQPSSSDTRTVMATGRFQHDLPCTMISQQPARDSFFHVSTASISGATTARHLCNMEFWGPPSSTMYTTTK